MNKNIFALALSIMLLSSTFAATAANFSIELAQPSSIISTQKPVPTPPKVKAESYIVISAESGKILAEENSHERMPPASLTKIMTMYLVSQALKNNQITLDEKVHISRKASRAEGSKMFLREGERVKIKDLILGVIVDSGNDASIALAEHLAGSEDTFVSMMNAEAKHLGMNESHFTDCTGMPDAEHYSTAYDLAILSNALVSHFPEFYPWYSQKWFTFNNIKQPNRNRLLWRDEYVDGIKTGHTNEAGYCLAASAKKDGMRIFTIVMKSPSASARADATQQLMTYAFRFYKTYKLYSTDDTVSQPRVWKGDSKTIPLGVNKNIVLTIPKGQYKSLKISTSLPKPLKAPIEKGKIVGTLTISLGGDTLVETNLIAKETVAKGSLLSRMSDSVSMAISADDDDQD